MEDSKRKLLGSIIGLIVFILCIASLTFAYFRWRSGNEIVDIGIHDGGIKYVYSNTNNNLTSNNLSPVLDYQNTQNLPNMLYTDYTATNMTVRDAYEMTAILHINSISNNLKSSAFKWALLEGSGNTYTTVVKQGNFSSAVVGNNNLDFKVYLIPGENKNYRFIMYIDGNVQNNPSNGSINAELELCDVIVQIMPITLNNNGANQGQGGTETIYLKYGVGVYKDSMAYTTQMTPTANPITSPTKTGRTFLGYYDEENKYATTDGRCDNGHRLIDGVEQPFGATENVNEGFITSYFNNRPTYFDDAATIFACYRMHTYNVSIVTNGGTVTRSKENPIQYEYERSNETDLSLTVSKVITATIRPNSTSGAHAASGEVNIPNNTSTATQTFSGWTGSNINTTTSKYGNANKPTTNWTNGATKTTPYATTYFRNLNPNDGQTVTLTANWTPVGIQLQPVSRENHTCGYGELNDSTATAIVYPSGHTYTPAADALQSLEFYAVCYKNNFVNTTKNKYYAYLSDALSDVESNQTIKAQFDTIDDYIEKANPTLASGKTGVTIDLNGKNVSIGNKVITNSGSLTIISSASGGTLSGTGSSVINNGTGTLTVTSGTISGTQHGISTTTGPVTVNGGTVRSTATTGNYDGIYKNGASGTITVSSGTVTGYRSGIYNNIAGPISITGGTVSGTTNGIYNKTTGTINITGGTVTGNTGITNAAAGPITVNGTGAQVTGTSGNGITGLTGAITVTKGTVSGSQHGISSTTGTVNVNGGTVTSTATTGNYDGIYKNGASGTVTVSSGSVTGYRSGIYNNGTSQVTISGGTVTGTTQGIYNNSTGTISVTGGTVTGNSGIVNKTSGPITINGSGVQVTGTTANGINSLTGTLTLTTGTVTGATNGISATSGTVNINGGSVTGGTNGISITTGAVNVNGGTVTSTATSGTNAGIYKNGASGTLTVSAGTVSGYYGIYNNVAGPISITGGTVTGTVNGIYNKTTGTITVTGGTIQGASHGIHMVGNGTLTMGENSGTPSTTTPLIKTTGTSDKYGVYIQVAGATYNFYDGKVTSASGTGKSIYTPNNYVINVPDNYDIVKTTTSGTETAILVEANNYQNMTTNKKYIYLYRAMNEVADGQTIKVLANTTETTAVTLASGKTVTLNLNGKTVALTGVNITNNGTLTVSSSATGGTLSSDVNNVINTTTNNVTISGGTVTGPQTVINATTGSVTVSGGNVTSTATSGNYDSIYKNGASGTVTVSSGSVTGYRSGIWNNGTSQVTISGGTVTGTTQGIYNNSTGTISVTGGTVTGNAGIVNKAAGPITVNGTNATVNGTSGNGITGLTGTITVNNGAVTGTNNGINATTGTVIIKGGTITGTSHGVNLSGAGTLTMGENSGTTSTTNPLIKTIGTSNTYGVYVGNASATYNFYDGKVTSDSGTGKSIYTPNNYLITVPDGYDIVKTTTNSTETAILMEANNYQNTTTNKKYIYLYRAIAEMSGGQTIKVLSNTTETTAVTIPTGKAMTLDVNGKTVTLTGVNITNNESLTISNSGTGGGITGNTNNVINTGTHNLTISGGTVTGPQTVISATTGSVTISGGNVTSTATSGNYDGINKNGTSGTVTVSSGSVTGYRAGIWNNAASDVTVSGGTVTGTTSGINNNSTGTISVSGGTVTATTQGIYNNSTGSINVTGGTISSKTGIVNKAAGPITVNGTNAKVTGTAGNGITGVTGAVTVTKGEVKGSQHGISSSTGDVTINGGTVSSTATTGNYDGISKSGTGTISVSSGTVTGYRSGIYNGAAGTITVTGGTISGNNGIQNSAAGPITINGSSASVSGTAGNGIVGQTGAVTVTTGTVTGTGSGITSTTGTVTVNGGTVTSTVASGTNSGIYKNGASGLVTVSSGTVSGYYGIYNNGTAPISVTGGTVTGTTMNGIYNKSTGTITVTGGTIQGTSHGIHMFAAGTLTMGENGGTPSTTTPLIKTIGTSNVYGVYIGNASATYNFYDGKVTSASGTGKSIYTPNATYVINVPDNYDIVKTTSSGTETAILSAANNYQNTTTNKKYIYLYRAMSEVATGQTIKVLTNTTETAAVTLASGKTVTLDLNGKTVTLTDVNITNNGTLTVSSSATGGSITGNTNNVINTGASNLTISGGTVTGPQTVINATTGSVTVSGGSVTSTATSGTSDAIYKNGTSGTVTVSSGSVTGYRSAIYNNNASNITISGGTITGTTQGIYNANAGTITVSSGTITGTTAGIYNNSTGTIAISGGSVTGTTQGIYNNSTGAINVTGGTVSGNNGIVNKAAGPITVNGSSAQVTGTTAIGINSVTGALTLTNGTITGKTHGISSTTGAVNINGGTVTTTATSGTNAAIYKNGASGTVTITAGTVSGYYGIYNNVAGPISVTGGTVTGTTMNGIYNKTTGTITVTGGTIQGTSHGIHLVAAGTLTMGENSGTPSTTTPLIKTIGTSNVYGVYVQVAGATYNFYDGKVTSASGTGKSIYTTSNYLINVPDGYDIVKTTTSGTETAILSAANSYQNTTTNKKYIYLYRALAEVATGQTIKVLANTTETVAATLASGKTVTLDLNGKTITLTDVNITNNGTLTVSSSASGGSITGNTNNIINTGASNLTISGGTITGPQTVINATTGSVTVSGGNVTSTATTGNYDGIYKNGTSGTVTVSSGSVTGYRAGIYNNAASNVTVSGGSVTGTTQGIYNGSTGTVTVSGGTVTGTTQGIFNSGTGTIAVSGGTVSGTTQGIYNNSTGAINVTGGTVSGNNGIVNKTAGPITVNGSSAQVTGTTAIGINSLTGALTLTNGTITGKTHGISSTTGAVNINGGTVTTTATSGTNAAIYKNGTSGTVTVSAGTVSGYYGIYNNVAGPISITGGTVTGTGMNGIYNKATGTITVTGGTVQGASHGIHLTVASTFTMGESGGTPSTTTPVIKTTGTSDKYGVYVTNASSTYNFYDGKVQSSSGTGKSIYLPSNFLITVPDGYDVSKSTSSGVETAILAAANNYQNTTTNKKYMYLNRAMSEVATGQTIKALANTTETASATIASGKTVTLDLNGKNITMNSATITNNGTLTISSSATGGTITGTANNMINTGASNLTISGGTVTSTQTVISATTGSVTVSGGNVTSTATTGNCDGIYKNGASGTVTVSSGSVTGYRAGIYNNAASDVTVSGGTVTGTTQGIYNNTTGTISISGGTITGTTQGINNNSTGTINVTGGTTTGNSGIVNKAAAPITVNGTNAKVIGTSGNGITGLTGAVTVTKGEVKGSTHGISSTTGNININGGTVTSTATAGNSDGINKSSTGTISISSGTVTGYRAGVYNGAAGTVTVTGGTVTGNNGIQNGGAGPITINGSGVTVSGTAGSGIVGQTGAVTVTTGTVTGTGSGITSTTGTVTVNGGTVTSTVASGTNSGIYKNGASGLVTVSSGTVSGYYGIYNNAAGPISVTGGTVTGTTMVGIYNKTTGAITVTGGTIQGTSHGIQLAGAGSLTMGENGGTPSTTIPLIKTIGTSNAYGVHVGNASATYNFYDGKVTSASGTGKSIYVPNTSYIINVPDNYDVIKTTSSGTETAVLATANNYQNMSTNKKYIYLYRALAEVATGQTVKALVNTTETNPATLAASKTVTLDLNGKTVTLTGANIVNNGTLTISTSSSGGKITGDGDNVINNGTGTLTVSSGTIEGTKTVITSTTGPVTISGGTITSTATTGNYDGIYKNGASGTVTVSSGSVTGYRAGIYNNGTSQVTISGGTVTGTTQGIYNNTTGTISVTGGTVTGNNGIVNKAAGPITVNGSSVQVTGTSGIGINSLTGALTLTTGTITGSTHGISSTTGTVTINGGTVTTTAATGTNAAIYKNGASGTVTVSAGTVSGYYGIYNNIAGPISITGGTVTGTAMNGIYNKTTGNITITGGTIQGTSHGVHLVGAGTLTMGANSGTPSTTTPLIKTVGTSNTYGVYVGNASATYNFYDGKVTSASGRGKAIKDDPSTTFTINTPTNYGVAKSTSGTTETAILGILRNITLTKGTGVDTLTGTNWASSPGATITKSIAEGHQLLMSEITINYNTGYHDGSWTLTSGSGSLSNNIFTVGSGVATLTANAIATPAPTVNIIDHDTFSLTTTSGIAAYYVSTSSTRPNPGNAQTSFSLNKWVKTPTTGNLTTGNLTSTTGLSGGNIYYIWAEHAANTSGAVSASSAIIPVRTVVKNQGTGTTLTMKYDSSAGAEFGSGAATTTVYVLDGSKVNVSASLNAGYNTLVFKKGNTNITDGDKTINENSEFTTSATPTQYPVSLDKGTCVTNGTTSVTATYDSTTISPSPITMAYTTYTINGFGTAASRNSDGATVSSTNDIVSTVTTDGYYTASGGNTKVLTGTTAAWVASVSGWTDASKKWKKASSATVYAKCGAHPAVTLPTITKPGNVCGWTTSSTGTTIESGLNSGASYVPTANKTLYGVCQENSVKIKVRKNNANWSNSNVSISLSTSNTTDNASTAFTKTATENEVTIYGIIAGQTYYIWASKNEDTITPRVYTGLSFTAVENNNSDKTVDYYTVTIKRNDNTFGTTSKSSFTVLKNQTMTASSNTLTLSGTAITATPSTATGYDITFDKWTQDSTSGTQISSTAISITAAKTVYANFIKTPKSYTVTLNKNSSNGGATNGTTEITVTYNTSSINPPTITLARGTSYNISGFETAASRGSDGATVDSTSTLPSTRQITGYWTAATGGSKILEPTPTATYNSGSVSGYLSSGKWIRDGSAELYAQFGAQPSITLHTITKPDYVCGWTTSSTGTNIIYSSGDTITPSSSMTLYGVCIPREKEYTPTGAVPTEPYTTPVTSWYKIEAWGAQGGDYSPQGIKGGKGAYTSGYIYLTKGTDLYPYVGKQPAATTAHYEAGGWNGGGNSGFHSTDYSRGGGGASDIRLTSGAWNNATSLNSRIMVAAGGGGSVYGGTDYNLNGANGGGLIGNPGTSAYSGSAPQGGKQSTYGTGHHTQSNRLAGFGFGGGAESVGTVTGWGGGGGSGYYGGALGHGFPGASGSSYISGHAGVNSITSASSRTHTANVKHYSGKYFINSNMETGVNTGDGKVKITIVDAPTRINTQLNNVRYIKDCINGSSANTGNHWVEIQATKDGVNLAKGKTVTGTSAEDSSTPYSNIVNGKIDTHTGSSGYGSTSATGKQCVTVDLGSTYNLDEVAVWHYYNDGRAYNQTETYVSSNNSSFTLIYARESTRASSDGTRISAYEAPKAYSHLTVDPNGGEFNGSTAQSHYVNESGTKKLLIKPTKVGATFNGWTVTSGTGGTITKYGTGLYNDEYFASGVNSMQVYNWQGNVTHTIMDRSSDDPIQKASKMIKIESSGDTAPGKGGFYQNTSCVANTTFYHVIVAKIPVGYTINNANNSIGTGGTTAWLTSNKGTGQFETYIYRVNCGTGTLSTFGHVYLKDDIADGTNPVTWYVGYTNIFNASSLPNNSAQTYEFNDQNVTLTAQWDRTFECPSSIGGTVTYSGKTWERIADVNGYCGLIMQGETTTTGTYDEAHNKIRDELRGNGNTQFALEEDQGLIGSTIDSNVDGFSVSTITGLHWIKSGTIYDSSARKSYTVGTPVYVYTGSCNNATSSSCMTTDRYTSFYTTCSLSTNLIAGNRSVSNNSSTYSVTEGTCSAPASSQYYSKSYTSYQPFAWVSSSSFKLNKYVNGPTTGSERDVPQNRVQFYQCGGDYHGQHVYSIAATSTTNYVEWKKITSPTSQTNHSVTSGMTAYYAGAAVSTTTSTTNGITRTYNHTTNSGLVDNQKCMRFNQASESHATNSYPIHYRPRIYVWK